MNENINNKIQELKSELSNFLKQKDNIFADYMRLEGIVGYLNVQLDKLDPDWKKKEEEAFLAKQKNTPQVSSKSKG